MAHKKGVGSTDNGRDSDSKRLGVKLFGGQAATAGNIIIRQRGTKYHPGDNVYMGKDFTIHAKVDGTVAFRKRRSNRTYVSIVPADAVAVAPPAPAKKGAAPKQEAAPAARSVAAEAPAPAAPKAAPAAKADKIELPNGKSIKQDDLKMVEGIGPKIEGLLNDGGIHTFAQLANSGLSRLQEILDAAGSRYKMHDPGTWAKQAEFAAAGNWDKLQEYQDYLQGGKDPS